jgi:hypothetical protein
LNWRKAKYCFLLISMFISPTQRNLPPYCCRYLKELCLLWTYYNLSTHNSLKTWGLETILFTDYEAEGKGNSSVLCNVSWYFHFPMAIKIKFVGMTGKEVVFQRKTSPGCDGL